MSRSSGRRAAVSTRHGVPNMTAGVPGRDLQGVAPRAAIIMGELEKRPRGFVTIFKAPRCRYLALHSTPRMFSVAIFEEPRSPQASQVPLVVHEGAAASRRDFQGIARPSVSIRAGDRCDRDLHGF